MTTLISAGGNDWQRRCDANCHNAQQPTCVCICGGRFHGKGFAQAQAALTEQDTPWLQEHGFTIAHEAQQRRLT